MRYFFFGEYSFIFQINHINFRNQSQTLLRIKCVFTVTIFDIIARSDGS